MVISLSQTANSNKTVHHMSTLTNVDPLPADNSTVPATTTTDSQTAASSSLSDLPTHQKPTRLKHTQMRQNSMDNIADADASAAAAAVVLRTKSHSTMVLPIKEVAATLATKSHQSGTGKTTTSHQLDRSYSMPVVEAQRRELNDNDDNNKTAVVATAAAPIGLDQIAEIRSFLESDYIPDEYWHLQRDSFIHRSYNEKLVARKNAADKPPSTGLGNAAAKKTAPTNTRPVSMGGMPNAGDGAPAAAPMQRMSFIRNSLNTIRRSFSTKNYQKQKSVNGKKVKQQSGSEVDSGNNNSDAGEKIRVSSGGGERLNVQSLIRNGHSRNSSTSSCKSNR